MTQGVVQHSTSSTVSVKIPWFDLCSSSLCGLVSSLLLQCWIAQIYQIWFDLPSHFSLTWLLMVVIRGGQRNAKAPPPAWEKELDMSPNSRQLGPPDTADIDTALHIPRSLLKEFSPKFQVFYQRTRKVVSSFTTLERLHFFLFFMICLCTWRDLIQNVALDLMLKYVMNARILFVGLQIAHCTLVSFQGKLEI